MKNRILTFIIGILVGAILATSGFYIYNKSIKNNQNKMMREMKENGQMQRPDANMENPPPEVDFQKDNKVIPVVKLNEEITLKNNKTIKLEDKEVYFTIEDFVYSPPPEGAQAIWSGLAVIYKLEIDGKIYETNDVGILEGGQELSYKINILDSDYKTFAKIKISENN